MRHMLGNLSPNYFERTKRYMMLRASQQGTDLTVSGTPPLSLPNSLGKPLKAYNVALSPYQDLHGYDSPWPAGGGANKCDIDNITLSSPPAAYGLTITKDIQNGSITISGTPTYSSAGGKQFIVFYQSGAYSAGLKAKLFLVSKSANVTDDMYFITNVNSNNSVAIVINVTDTNDVNIVIKPVLYAGDTAPTTWSPYANICPILGTDKLNIFVEESYDPAATPKAVITFDNTVYGGTYDAVTGTLTVNTMRYKFTGSEVLYVQQDNRVAIKTGYVFASTNAGWCTDFAFYATASQNFIYLNTTLTSAEVQAYMASHDVYAVCELATPLTYTIAAHTIPTPKGDATTWATAEDGTVDSMEVTYVGKA